MSQEVTVNLIVSVDPEAWNLTYGTGTNKVAVRNDVRTYIEGLINDSAAASECSLAVVP